MFASESRAFHPRMGAGMLALCDVGARWALSRIGCNITFSPDVGVAKLKPLSYFAVTFSVTETNQGPTSQLPFLILPVTIQLFV
jgi:hypothetical protein